MTKKKFNLNVGITGRSNYISSTLEVVSASRNQKKRKKERAESLIV